jgi:hypothetical protein
MEEVRNTLRKRFFNYDMEQKATQTEEVRKHIAQPFWLEREIVFLIWMRNQQRQNKKSTQTSLT